MIELTIAADAKEPRPLLLDSGVFVLGCGLDVDIALDDGLVAPRHCELTVDGTTVLFRALKAENHLLLDGTRVMEGQLEPGRVLEVGSVAIRIAGTPPAEGAANAGLGGGQFESDSLQFSGGSQVWSGGSKTGAPAFEDATGWQAPHGSMPQTSGGRGGLTGLGAGKFWKLALFGMLGGLGSIMGCLAGEPLLRWIDSDSTPFLAVGRFSSLGSLGMQATVGISTWAGLQALCVAACLVAGQNALLRRKWLSGREAGNILLRAGLVACVAGLGSQKLAEKIVAGHPQMATLIQLACWMLFGGVMAPCMGKSIPNLPRVKAVVAGAFGGGFAASAMSLLLMGTIDVPHARLAGIAILGIYIGLMVAWVETSAREAALIVHWGEGERSILNLGPEPIVLGAGEQAHVALPQMEISPLEVASVTFIDGKVELVDHINESRQVLQHGSIVEIGGIQIEIQTDQ